VVTIVTVGIPRFSNNTVSWTLHDVHEPQSPLAARTATAPEDKSLLQSSGIGCP
jgi:hypothetical protein